MILTSVNDKRISKFIRNGIIIDTCVILEIVKGIVRTQRNSTDTGGWKKEYEKIVNLLELLRATNWKKFFLTPHVITETCSHFNTTNNKDADFKDIVEHIVSFIKSTDEKHIDKENFVSCIDYQSPIKLESGDLSIYAVADSFAKDKKQIAILTKDTDFTRRYVMNPYVMVIDYMIIQLDYSL